MTGTDDQRAAVLIDAQGAQDLVREGPPATIVLHVGGVLREVGIAGALPVSLGDFAGPGGGTQGERPLPAIETLQAAARRWGIDPDSRVILYDDKGGLQAARGWWVLRWAGVANVRLLDGGLDAWRAVGGDVAELTAVDRVGTVKLTPGQLPTIQADEAAEWAAAGGLLDARSAQAFAAGHIPGAINLPASANLAASGRFASSDALRARFAPASQAHGVLGISCGSGVSAAHHVIALASIGIPAALYVASWSGWSADDRRPVARSDIGV